MHAMKSKNMHSSQIHSDPSFSNPVSSQLRSLTQALNFGILGGGQLSQMLCLKAHELGLKTWVLSESSEDPAANVCNHHVVGNPHNPEALQSFFEKVDLITLESEFYDGKMLEQFAQKFKKNIFPPPAAMSLLQDRKTQKDLFIKLQIPTAEMIAFSQSDLSQGPSLFLETILQTWPQGMVLKKRVGGYDGYGTFFIRQQTDIANFLNKATENTPLKNTQDKLALSVFLEQNFIIEKLIPFQKELAVMIGRDQYGHFIHYPLVETRQERGRCDWVLGPTHHSRFESMLESLKLFLNELHYVGVMGVEFFDTGLELLVNEIAPRVHNSGHYTQDSFLIDQFKMHLQCVIGDQVPQPQLVVKHFAMVNLIGQSSEPVTLEGNLEGSLHWYCKQQNRKDRKMGHINFTSDHSPDLLLEKALNERKKVRL
jgi:phosphoribosylaminoimidazole carboxylase PurK protein